jgi:phospholipid/cholesterol/gamma-HCH transport system ATP-binding protein
MISIRNVSKSFGSQNVLKNVSLEIEPGMTTAIVGPSGVGKSVLMKLILGMLEPDSGDIYVFGKQMAGLRHECERNEIRARIGVLFQSAALLDSLTILENIAFPLQARLCLSRREVLKRVTAMIEALSLENVAHRYPQEVSIGTRKRAGLARALVINPEAILIDEPNTGLDPLVGQEVYDLISECRTRCQFTGIVISHELPEVFQISDRVAMLLGGEIVIEGTPEDIQASKNPAVEQFLNGWKDGPIKIQ